MFCQQCGKELEDSAIFCPRCGTRLKKDAEKLVIETQAEHNSKSANPQTIKSAIKDTNRKSRKRIPAIVLVALALALGASCAYAAYKVYEWHQEQVNAAPQEGASTNAEIETVEESQPEDDPEEIQQSAYAQYRDLLHQYSDKYGGVYTGEGQDNDWSNYIGGLSFASLVDFDNDGINELVCSYYDESLTGREGSCWNYVVEVWQYDKNEQSIKKQISTYARCPSNGGFAWVGLVMFDGRPCILADSVTPSYLEQSDDHPDGYVHTRAECWSINENQQAQSIVLEQMYPGPSTGSAATTLPRYYAIDGQQTDQATFSTKFTALTESSIPYCKNDNRTYVEQSILGYPLMYFNSASDIQESETVSETSKTLSILNY